MASFARDTFTATGGQTVFTITFNFIQNSHIVVEVNGVTKTIGASNDYTISGATLTFTSGLTNNDAVVLTRATSQSSRLTDYAAASILTENDLDNDSLQAFYMSQEAIDRANLSIGLVAAGDVWTAESKRLTLVATPTANNDAVTKKYADDLSKIAGNVIAPDNPGDDNRPLVASAGTFDWTTLAVTGGGTGSTTASAARTALGLVIGTDVLPELGVVSQADALAGTSTAEKIWTAARVSEGGGLPRSYLAGLGLSNGSDATNDINIAVGEARSRADDANLRVTTAIGKRIDADWVTGGTTSTPTGGISSSLTLANDTWYHVILGLVSGNAEVGFDTSVTGANLVSDHSFTNTRRIGSVRRGTDTNLGYAITGDEVLWNDPILDVSVTNQGTSVLSRTLSVPPGVKMRALLNVVLTHASILTLLYVRTIGQNDAPPSTSASPLMTLIMPDGSNVTGVRMEILTNTSSVITTRATQTNTSVRIVTLGYIDRRGRDD